MQRTARRLFTKGSLLPFAAATWTALSLSSRVAQAQSSPPARSAEPAVSSPSETPEPAAAEGGYALRPSVMLGMTQWLVFGGGNLAAQLKFGRWVAELSHGQGLQFERASALALTRQERGAHLAVGMPWTTGGGFGFQITPHLHVLLEAKVHRYQVEDDFGHELSYTSMTLGPGVFYDVYLYKGLFLQPNLRWWPTVASSYDRKALTARDGSEVRPDRHDLAPFVNVNLGWTFSGT